MSTKDLCAMTTVNNSKSEAEAIGRLPDFLLIGAMKAGSTTLWSHLNRHPSLFMCRPKEPQFFSRERVYKKGFDWYRGLFADAKPDQLCGEASVCYTRHPTFTGAPERIAEFLPEAKLLFVARDPVARALSHYRHNMLEARLNKRQPVLDFEAAVEADASILSSGHYVEQLDRYLVNFERDKILCVLLEDLISHQDETMERVAEFLGVDHHSFSGTETIVANPWEKRVTSSVVRWNVRRIRRSPIHTGLRIIPRPIRRKIHEKLMRSSIIKNVSLAVNRKHVRRIAAIQKEARAGLMEHYLEHNRAFRSLLGRTQLGWYDDPPLEPTREVTL